MSFPPEAGWNEVEEPASFAADPCPTSLAPASSPQVDFLSGGGSKSGAAASQALEHKVQQKRRTMMQQKLPKQRLVSTSLNSGITLPDAPPELLDIPDSTSLLGSKASLGRGMGLSSAGFGTGTGSGMGRGNMPGMTFQPITMFGMELKNTRKVAVVIDVSRSMTKYLPAVVSELDKIARQSVLVMHYGCGLKEAKERVDDKVRKAEGESFATFWQNWQGKASLKMSEEDRRKLKYDPGQPMPLERIYERLSGRPGTYFINFNGVGQTQAALMSNEVMEADTIYWFADFQDAVSEEVMADVRRKLKGRKQKLYMHASIRGKAFDLVREGLVVPLDGDVIEAQVGK
ncbi:MAG: hypothetical protein V4599_00745 [Verrucomicrobiota bacterium]